MARTARDEFQPVELVWDTMFADEPIVESTLRSQAAALRSRLGR